MGIIVQKYGGSSVASPEQILSVARRIVATRAEGHEVVVVVSAMGKTTDQLIELAHQVSANPHRRELDMLVTVGERMSMALLSMAIQDLGYPAVSFTGSQSGIITTNNHTNARIIRVTPVRIRAALDMGQIVIVAGFQGVSEQLEITSLGRGGSDTTAVALAAALGADYAEICSDVDGVYSADPRVVPNAQRIEQLAGDQMQQLASAGAKVLNAEAVEWAQRNHVEVVCSHNASPPPSGQTRPLGTRIVQQSGLEHARVLAVVAHPGLILLGPAQPGQAAPADLEATLMALGYADAEVWRLPNSWSAQIPRNPKNQHSLREALARLGPLQIREDLTFITLIGRALGSPPSVLAPARERLARLGLPIYGQILDAGRLAFLIDQSRATEAVRALHALFIEGC